MNGEPHLRWNPLAVLGRWRQLLWLTPLAALLTSLIWQLLGSPREVAAGVVDLGPAGENSAAAFCALLQSPEFVAAVGDGALEHAIASRVSCHALEGTSRVRIEVRQAPGADAARLCAAILKRSLERYPGQVAIHEGVHWQVAPWAERLQSFKGSVGIVFWGSLLLALGLAYLAEALEPRRVANGRSHPSAPSSLEAPMSPNAHRCWYPAFVIYRWRHVLWSLPLLACLGVVLMHLSRLRVDHALTVIQLNPSTSLLAGRSVPTWMSEQINIVQSPEVLGKVVQSCELAAVWKMGDTEALGRLREHVSCDAIPGTSLVELKVHKLPAVDSLEISKALTKYAGERLEADRAAETARLVGERRAVARKAAATLEAKLDAARAKFVAEAPHDGQTVDIGSRFESLIEIQADRRFLEQLRKQIDPAVGGCTLLERALIEHEAAHWPKVPAMHHLEKFAVSGAWTFGMSVLVAMLMAYVLEALMPRRVVEACD